MQGMYQMAKDDGIRRGVYRGLLGGLLHNAAYRTFCVGLYEPTRRLLAPPGVDSKDVPVLRKYIAAAFVGSLGSLVSNPLEILKTRQ